MENDLKLIKARLFQIEKLSSENEDNISKIIELLVEIQQYLKPDRTVN
jgi:hypothetical protein